MCRPLLIGIGLCVWASQLVALAENAHIAGRSPGDFADQGPSLVHSQTVPSADLAPFSLSPTFPASLVACLEDTWHYIHIEYLSSTFRHSSTHERFLGLGEPLVSSSWRNRPLHVGWFVGGLFPDDLIGSRVTQDTALFGGYRVGWDFDHYWGTEWRIGWSNPELHYPQLGTTGPSSRLMLTDLSLLYYPWGDSAIRPYALLGLGVTEVDFHDDTGARQDETLFTVPFGGGVKHHWRRWLSWRLELLDNFATGSGNASSMHNVSLTCSVEVHFGVRPRSYYPWNPSRHIW